MWSPVLKSPGRPAGRSGPTPALIELAAPPREASEPGASEPCLPPKVVARIGQRLRDYYADIMDEPVPERFTRLLSRIDAPPSDERP